MSPSLKLRIAIKNWLNEAPARVGRIAIGIKASFGIIVTTEGLSMGYEVNKKYKKLLFNRTNFLLKPMTD